MAALASPRLEGAPLGRVYAVATEARRCVVWREQQPDLPRVAEPAEIVNREP